METNKKECSCENKIKEGDTIKCIGIGYPHIKDEIFICKLLFENNTIAIENDNGFGARVFASDFILVEKRFCKGCYKDVTKDMWCSCGEQPLNKESTYSEEEMGERSL